MPVHNIPSYEKVDPYGSTQNYTVAVSGGTRSIIAAAGEILDFYFPKGYIDLSSLMMLFRYTCLPYTTAMTGTSQSIPRDAECLIDTLEVYLGDKKVNYITNYNQLFNVLSTYAFGAEHQIYRQSYQNNWVNGRMSQVSSLDGVQFCFKKWLGLLGLPIVLDTNKLGQLHIRITLAPAWVTTSNNGNHSWGIYDTYMKVRYYDNYNVDLPKYLEWDDYKSTYSIAPIGNFTTTLKVFSSRIDWALLKPLRTDHRIKTSSSDGNIGSTIAFGSPHNIYGFWNIAVNNKNIFRYKANSGDALAALQDIFGDNIIANYGLTSTGNSQSYDRCTALGCHLGFVDKIPEEVEISITYENGQTAVYYAMYVKTTSSLEIKEDGTLIHKI